LDYQRLTTTNRQVVRFYGLIRFNDGFPRFNDSTEPFIGSVVINPLECGRAVWEKCLQAEREHRDHFIDSTTQWLNATTGALNAVSDSHERVPLAIAESSAACQTPLPAIE
ncbi:MAG: hypothetical protein L0Y58_20680, partial [Verrucomicrobia subdivision 3 bacterium]|nr:hypothetical protein [Limisphaerales bacterium]